MALIEDPQKAVRLARAIASDISLYNEEKVKAGIENDSLFQILAEEIEEGRKLYHSRVSPVVQQGTNFYDRALVDVMLRAKGSIASRIW